MKAHLLDLWSWPWGNDLQVNSTWELALLLNEIYS